MSKTLKEIHDPTERANMTSCALGIHLNIDFESYGGTTSVRAMVDDKVIFHSTQADTVSFLCGLHGKVNSILALFSAENIHHQDKDACLRSLKDTCAPNNNIALYLEWIYGNKCLIRALSA